MPSSYLNVKTDRLKPISTVLRYNTVRLSWREQEGILVDFAETSLVGTWRFYL